MREWRGVVVQLAAIFALVWLVKGSGDERVIFTAIGALGPFIGQAAARARIDAAGGGPGGPRTGGGGLGVSIPPIVGALVGAVAIVLGVLLVVGMDARQPTRAVTSSGR